MNELDGRLREVIEQAASPVALGEVLDRDRRSSQPDSVGRSGRQRWIGVAALVALVAGGMWALGLWLAADDETEEVATVDVRSDERTLLTGVGARGQWRQLDDPDGVFSSAEVFEEGVEVSAFSRVEVVDFVRTSDGRLVAVGSERVGLEMTGAVWERLDDGTWRRILGLDAGPGPGADDGPAGRGVRFAAATERDGVTVVVGTDLAGSADDGSELPAALAWTSVDLRRWEAAELPVPSGAAITVHGVTATSEAYVAVGTMVDDSDVPSPLVWTSSDGRDWELVGPELFGEGVALDVAANGDDVIVVGQRQVEQAAVWLSDDGGRSWEAIAPPTATPLPMSDMWAVAVCDDGITAVGTYRAGREFGWEEEDGGPRRIFGEADIALWSSRDGRTWTAHPMPVTPERIDFGPAVTCGPDGNLVTVASVGPERAFTVGWLTGEGQPIEPVSALSGRDVTAAVAVEDSFLAAMRPLPDGPGRHVSAELWGLQLDP